MQYKIKSWIPIEEENLQVFPFLNDAIRELRHLQDMQPENRYEIHDVEGDHEVECYFCRKIERMSVAQDMWIPSFWHNEFVEECGPVCKFCSKRLKKNSDGEYFLPLGG